MMEFPHVKFINPDLNSEQEFYYLGETNDKFTRGKLYKVRNSLYSEDANITRVEVLIATSDDGKIVIVNDIKFGNLSELRELKIKEILENE